MSDGVISANHLGSDQKNKRNPRRYNPNSRRRAQRCRILNGKQEESFCEDIQQPDLPDQVSNFETVPTDRGLPRAMQDMAIREEPAKCATTAALATDLTPPPLKPSLTTSLSPAKHAPVTLLNSTPFPPPTMTIECPALHGSVDIRAQLEQRLLSNLYALGYSVVPGTTLTQPVVVLFQKETGAIERLHGLIGALHGELSAIMGFVQEQQPFPDRQLNAWKEGVISRLITEVMPGLGGLVERVGCSVKAGLQANEGGVRVFVGTDQPM